MILWMLFSLARWSRVGISSGGNWCEARWQCESVNMKGEG